MKNPFDGIAPEKFDVQLYPLKFTMFAIRTTDKCKSLHIAYIKLVGHQSGRMGCHSSITSNQYPLHLVQADLIAAPVIELGGSG